MDLVTVSLDLLLAALLIAALAYGVRLERRLKALRDGHAVFAQAVRELDQSVLRAEAGLDQLRKAGEEARDGLHDRILKARDASAELERMLARAERVRSQPQPAPQIAPQIAPQPAPLAASRKMPELAIRGARQLEPRPRAPARVEDAAERVAQAILGLGELTPEPEPDVLELRVPELRRPEPLVERRPETQPSRRPRAAADEDLFETPPPELRRALGGRR